MKPWIKWTLVAVPVLVGGFLIVRKISKRKEEESRYKKYRRHTPDQQLIRLLECI